MSKEKIKKNVSRAMNNLASMPIFNTTLKTEEVDYWLENFSDTVFCRGHLRQVVFEKITENNYKVSSSALFKEKSCQQK